MNEVRVGLKECKPGDVIARDIIDIRTGVVLCNKGHVLTQESLAWLDKFLYSDIYIANTSWNKVWNVEVEKVQKYEDSAEKLNDVLEGIRKNEPIQESYIKEIAGGFFEQLNANSTIMGCVSKVKSVDQYTYRHCMNVGMIAVLIGKWIKLPQDKVEKLFLSGLLHDVGKYRIDPNILNRHGALSSEEYAIVKKHVIYAYELIKDLKEVDDDIKEGVLCHHERIDGTGYPRELKNEEIHIFGRILAIADTYDAMISERVYKAKHTPFFVMETLMKEGFNKLDTNILLTFLKNIADYYIGVLVKLSNGEEGEVVFIHPHCVYRPIVKVGDKYLDLDNNSNIKIIDIL